MKKYYTLLLAACLAFVGLWAATSDRLDLLRADGSFVSFMTQDIDSITYEREGDGTAFTHMTVWTNYGVQEQFSLAEYTTVRYVGIGKEYYEIQRSYEDEAPLVMLDCINNDHTLSHEHPVDWTAQRAGKKVHFVVRPIPGYDYQLEIEGLYTGRLYTADPSFVFWERKEDNILLQDALCFFMPNEPVSIAVAPVERTTYEGRDFLGDYKGYGVGLAAGEALLDASQPTFQMQLRASGALSASSTDAQAYNLLHWYRYNEETGTFSYYYEDENPDDDDDLELRDQLTYGANGTFFAGDVAVVDIHDYDNDQIANTRVYLVAKGDFDYTCANRDASAYQSLVEMRPKDGTDTRWFFFNNYGYSVTEATLDFRSGTSIGQPCEALVSYDGDVRFLYTLKDGESQGTFTARGKEAGNYTSADGQGAGLQLDGFGVAQYDGRTYDYTIESGVVSITVNGQPTQFVLDMQAHTYTLAANDNWEGYDVYENNAVIGSYCGGDEQTKNSIKVMLNQNLMGTERAGYAAISVNIYNGTGQWINAVNDCQRYLYDAQTRTLTITNVLVGNANGGSSRRDLAFVLSQDGKQLYMTGDARIYATSYEGSYVTVDAAHAMNAVILQAPDLYDAYKAKVNVSYFGNDTQGEAVLKIDADANGNAKEGYASLTISAMGTNLLDGCVPYEIKGMKLILKGYTVGDGSYGEYTTDIEFDITADARLLGKGTYNGTGMTAGLMTVNLDNSEFMPDLPAKELASEYTGKYYIGADDGEAEVPTVNAKLQLDRKADGTIAEGYAYFEVKSAAVKFGLKSVPYEIANDKLILKGYGLDGQPDADVVFTINADGTLQGEGKLRGMYSSGSGFWVDLSHGVLSPVE